MAENIPFTSFPANKYEALAMLYMQNQNLSGFTPEQLLDKYQDAYARIRDHDRARGQVKY